MPTYHFRCDTCATVADRKLPFGSEEKPSCDTCSKPMVKFIKAPHVQFKGGGFYKTDAASKQKPESSGTTSKVTPSSPSPSAS
ncbi:MAG: FmdB family zinc ribbon protein [Candidatus Peribacteraceae bacterium]